jgi:hypothetical protein
MKMRMSRLQHLTVFSVAAVHLLLFSICPVSSRIYRTNDAVVIEGSAAYILIKMFVSNCYGFEQL